MPSAYGVILNKVVSDIQGLSLTGIAGTSVVRRRVATDRKQDMPALPGILVSPTGRIQHNNEGSNLRDDITYPVLVLFVQAGNQEQDNDDNYLTWHETVRKKFIHQPLGVECVYTCDIDPRDTYHIPSWLQNLDVGGIVFRFKNREVRG